MSDTEKSWKDGYWDRPKWYQDSTTAKEELENTTEEERIEYFIMREQADREGTDFLARLDDLDEDEPLPIKPPPPSSLNPEDN